MKRIQKDSRGKLKWNYYTASQEEREKKKEEDKFAREKRRELKALKEQRLAVLGNHTSKGE